MRRLSVVALLFVSVMTLATSAHGGDSVRTIAMKGVNLAGKVSNDGKTLLADDDNLWNVNNPDILKGLGGRHVTVTCRMDLSKRAILVLYIIQPEMKHAANLSDSAFRR